jgi:hypothetical protein
MRTLLIVVLLVSLPLSWLGVRVRRARRNRDAAAEVRKLATEIQRCGGNVRIEQLQPPNWLDRLLGDPGVVAVVGMTGSRPFRDSHLKHLKGLTSLKYLSLSRTQVTDAGVAELQKALPKCRIGRSGLAAARGLIRPDLPSRRAAVRLPGRRVSLRPC